MSTNPYEPTTEIGDDDGEPEPESSPPLIAKFAAIIFGLNGFVVLVDGATMIGALVILIGVLFWLGGGSVWDESL